MIAAIVIACYLAAVVYILWGWSRLHVHLHMLDRPKPDYGKIWQLEEELGIEHTVPRPPVRRSALSSGLAETCQASSKVEVVTGPLPTSRRTVPQSIFNGSLVDQISQPAAPPAPLSPPNHTGTYDEYISQFPRRKNP